MALEKVVVVDQITILEDGQMQIREATRIMEDGVMLSQSYHRKVITPDQDISEEHPRVQAAASAMWTDDVKTSFLASKQEASLKMTPTLKVNP